MNAYWDAVKPYVVDGVIRRDGSNHFDAWANEMRDKFSWTVTDPATVRFVAMHLGPVARDPMAGSGWWSCVLAAQFGIRLRASDAGKDPNDWVYVEKYEAEALMRTKEPVPILLAWPPRHESAGARVVRAYRGQRIVHMGAEGRTSDGDEEMRRLLRTHWRAVAQHTPVRWYGVQDYVTVYERK